VLTARWRGFVKDAEPDGERPRIAEGTREIVAPEGEQPRIGSAVPEITGVPCGVSGEESQTPKAQLVPQTARRSSLSPSEHSRSAKMRFGESVPATGADAAMEVAVESAGDLSGLGAALRGLRPFTEPVTEGVVPERGSPAAEDQSEAAPPVKRKLEFGDGYPASSSASFAILLQGGERRSGVFDWYWRDEVFEGVREE